MSSITPLFDPRDYFSVRSNPLVLGTAVVVVPLLAQVVWASVVPHFVAGREPLSAEHHIAIAALATGLFLFLNLLAWVVVATTLHYGVNILQSLRGGSSTGGTFSNALAVAGWAYAPNHITEPIDWASAYVQSSTSLAAIEAITAPLEPIGTDPLSFLLLSVVTVWSMYILTIGTAETHDVSIETAAIPAGIVVVGAIMLTPN